MTASDLIEFSGYLFTSFTSGYIAGFLMRAFFRGAGNVR